MRDLQRVAARLLRASLGSGAALVAAAIVLDAAGWTGPARGAGAVGVGIVVAAPFATLIAIAVAGRRTGMALYAVASVALAVAGLLLAR